MYCAAIGMMSVSAFYFSQKARYDSNLKFASVAIFLGSFLFIVCDVNSSQRTHNNNIESNTKEIMSYIAGSSYWLAQFLIAQGGIQLSTVSTIYSTSKSEEV
jgi:hypothetical protein